ncbi:hypothetical protein [Streptomyces sp. NPDC096324]|uniref:hypothetical protein n=1 Tax=Streptomyces sp. NPDC096324 TaxID=3366085 RepID=UPI003828EE09
MPAEFGPWATVYGRFRVWRNAGVFSALLVPRVDTEAVDVCSRVPWRTATAP